MSECAIQVLQYFNIPNPQVPQLHNTEIHKQLCCSSAHLTCLFNFQQSQLTAQFQLHSYVHV